MFVSSSTKRVVRFVPILTTRILLYIAAAWHCLSSRGSLASPGTGPSRSPETSWISGCRCPPPQPSPRTCWPPPGPSWCSSCSGFFCFRTSYWPANSISHKLNRLFLLVFYSAPEILWCHISWLAPPWLPLTGRGSPGGSKSTRLKFLTLVYWSFSFFAWHPETEIWESSLPRRCSALVVPGNRLMILWMS